MVEGAPNTEASAKDVPLDSALAEISEEIQRQQHLRPTNRLGVRVTTHEGKTAVVAGDSLAALWEAGSCKRRDLKTSRIPHVSAHLYDSPNSKQQRT